VKFTVTMECEGCGEKFAGQADHLVDAVTGMVVAATKADHAGGPMNQELESLAQKAGDVNAVGEVLEVLGLEPGDVEIMPVLTKKQFLDMMRTGKPPEEQSP
jgi:hypothetical protein